MAASVTTRMGFIEEQIDSALEQLENDPGASPALRAVIEELHRNTSEACEALNGSDADGIRDQVIEVEQAADSAKRAAEAEENIASATRAAVIEIHDALSELKRDVAD